MVQIPMAESHDFMAYIEAAPDTILSIISSYLMGTCKDAT